MRGGSGNDVLIGGAGNDRLEGSTGNDTYFLNRGGGHDTISEVAWHEVKVAYIKEWREEWVWEEEFYYEYDPWMGFFEYSWGSWVSYQMPVYGHRDETCATEGGNDTLQVGYGILLSDLLVNTVRDESGDENLKIELKPMQTLSFSDGSTAEIADSVTIEQWSESRFRVETFTMITGFSFSMADIDFAKTGNNDDEVLDAAVFAASGREQFWLAGGEGDDTILGSASHDILIGGTGQDRIEGGHGNDTYLYSFGDGELTISDVGGRDAIAFDVGIRLEDLVLAKEGDLLSITLREYAGAEDESEAPKNQIRIEQWSQGNHKIEQLQFSDGQTFDLSRLHDARTHRGEGNYKISANHYNNWIETGSGNDEIFAYLGMILSTPCQGMIKFGLALVTIWALVAQEMT